MSEAEADAENGSATHAEILAPAPVLALAAFIVGAAAHYFRPVQLLPSPWNLVGVVLILAGIGVLYSGLRVMRGVGKSPAHHDEPPELLTDGVFQISRNPLYLGVCTVYAGLALVLNSVWPFVTLVPLIIYFDRVARREENYLQQRFGDEYKQYQENVRRWL